jgi:hypothetical protein
LRHNRFLFLFGHEAPPLASPRRRIVTASLAMDDRTLGA